VIAEIPGAPMPLPPHNVIAEIPGAPMPLPPQ
jgi:hypothetical protein